MALVFIGIILFMLMRMFRASSQTMNITPSTHDDDDDDDERINE